MEQLDSVTDCILFKAASHYIHINEVNRQIVI